MTTAVLAQYGRLHQEVDGVDDEGLLVERVGVASVSILIARGLQEADGREVAGVDGVEEVVRVVLVVARIALLSDGLQRSGTRVLQVLRSRRSTGRLMVRNVVASRSRR